MIFSICQSAKNQTLIVFDSVADLSKATSFRYCLVQLQRLCCERQIFGKQSTSPETKFSKYRAKFYILFFSTKTKLPVRKMYSLQNVGLLKHYQPVFQNVPNWGMAFEKISKAHFVFKLAPNWTLEILGKTLQAKCFEIFFRKKLFFGIDPNFLEIFTFG